MTSSRCSAPSGTPGASRSPTAASAAPAGWRSRFENTTSATGWLQVACIATTTLRHLSGAGTGRRPLGAAALRLYEAIPPHLTLLSPWLPDPTECAATERLQGTVGHVARFELTFRTVNAFAAGTVYLSPDPSPGLETLFQALLTAFPDHPPSGGQFDGWIPHLMESRRVGEQIAAEVRAALRAHGCLHRVVEEVSG